MKIKNKILVCYSLIFVLFITSIGFISIKFLNMYLIENALNEMDLRVKNNQDIYLNKSKVYSKESLKLYSDFIAQTLSKDNISVSVFDKKGLLSSSYNGELTFIKNNNEGINQDEKYVFDSERGKYIIVNKTINYFVPIKYTNQILGVVEYKRPLKYETDIVIYFEKIYCLSSLMIFIILIWVSIYFSKAITKPLVNLTNAVLKFSEGEIIKVDESSKDETGILSSTFNAMEEKLLNQIEEQKEFLDNASHELKTPVTSILGYTEYLKDNQIYDKEIMESLYSDAVRMKELVIELLEISRLERHGLLIRKGEIDIEKIINEVLSSMQFKAQKFNIELKCVLEEGIIINADYKKILQVIINLVDNAIKYSKPNSIVEIKLYKSENSCCIEVIDSGIGIPEEEINNIFKRFYRCKNSSAAGGSGLGLSIVDEIVKAHSGNIIVKSSSYEGTTFKVILPI